MSVLPSWTAACADRPSTTVVGTVWCTCRPLRAARCPRCLAGRVASSPTRAPSRSPTPPFRHRVFRAGARSYVTSRCPSEPGCTWVLPPLSHVVPGRRARRCYVSRTALLPLLSLERDRVVVLVLRGRGCCGIARAISYCCWRAAPPGSLTLSAYRRAESEMPCRA